jgi:hypothetical protein
MTCVQESCHRLEDASIACCGIVQSIIDWFDDLEFSRDALAASMQAQNHLATAGNFSDDLRSAIHRWQTIALDGTALGAIKLATAARFGVIFVGNQSYVTAHEAAEAYAQAVKQILQGAEGDGEVGLCREIKKRLRYVGYHDLYGQIEAEFYAVAGQQDTKPDTGKKSLPDSVDVSDLCRDLKKGLRKGKTQTQVAREFTSGNVQKADNLLRQARRYRHLWE